MAPKSANAPTIWRPEWPWIKRWRRRLLAPLFRLPDSGRLGLQPLELHGLVCGFPRSGTTVMQLMLQFAYPDARGFPGEMEGWRAATYVRRNHAVMFSKVPEDLFVLEPLRAFYAARRARLRVLLLYRDPRDLLTSHHARHASYFLSPESWRRYDEAFRIERSRGDVLPLRYEDLVRDPHGVQSRVEAFLQRPATRPFVDFHSADWTGYDTFALNGLRPLEAGNVGRWRHEEHRERMADVLAALPELPAAVRELGYETSDDWMPEKGLACRPRSAA